MKSPKGFTLLEVIFALFLLGLVLLPVLSTFNKGSAIIQHNYLKKQAIDFAASALSLSTYNQNAELTPPHSSFLLSFTPRLQGSALEKTATVIWSDGFDRSASVAVSRNFYSGVD